MIRTIHDLDMAIESLKETEAKDAIRSIYIAVFGAYDGGQPTLMKTVEESQQLRAIKESLRKLDILPPGMP